MLQNFSLKVYLPIDNNLFPNHLNYNLSNESIFNYDVNYIDSLGIVELPKSLI